eukprot:759666-Hanusia_phi.AAC.3
MVSTRHLCLRPSSPRRPLSLTAPHRYDAVLEVEEGRVLVDAQGLSARQRGWLRGISSQLLAFS